MRPQHRRVCGGGRGDGSQGVMGVGSVREAREERTGDGIPIGVGVGREK